MRSIPRTEVGSVLLAPRAPLRRVFSEVLIRDHAQGEPRLEAAPSVRVSKSVNQSSDRPGHPGGSRVEACASVNGLGQGRFAQHCGLTRPDRAFPEPQLALTSPGDKDRIIGKTHDRREPVFMWEMSTRIEVGR